MILHVSYSVPKNKYDIGIVDLSTEPYTFQELFLNTHLLTSK